MAEEVKRGRGNPYPHHYKYGKITKPIDLGLFGKLLDRVKLVNRYGYSVVFLQALLALFYWTGFRKSEILGRRAIKYKVDCPECYPKGVKRADVNPNCVTCHGSGYVIRVGKKHPGIVKGDMTFKEGFLLVYSIGENVLKHGIREEPVWLHESMPYVSLIISQWKTANVGQPVFSINGLAFWKICKSLDPKFTIHFLRHNRVTDLSGNRKLSLADVVSQTGLSPQTVTAYMMRAGRFTREVGDVMREEYGEVKPS